MVDRRQKKRGESTKDCVAACRVPSRSCVCKLQLPTPRERGVGGDGMGYAQE